MSDHSSHHGSEPPPLTSTRWSQSRVQWLCTVMGAWGVATGFAVFILLWTHGRPHPLTFLAGLLVAALIAYIAELLRDVIKEGVAIPAITGPRVVVTVLLLMIIELVVHAGTALVQLGGDRHEAASAHSELQEIFAPLAGADSNVMTEAIGLMIAWMLVGAVVARRLARIISLQVRGNRQGLLRGAREGVLGGLIAAPVCALACQMLIRGGHLVSEMVVRGDAWAAEVRSSLGHLSLNSGWVIALKLPTYLWLGAYEILQWGRGAGGVVLAILLGVAMLGVWRYRKLRWVQVAALASLMVVLAPLPTEVDRLLHVALLAIIVWIVPGFMLGVAAPLLRGAGDEPRLWGLIAFAAAALLSLLTLLKFANPWCYALAFGLVLIGLLFFRGAPLREYWPLAAAAMASMVSGVMVFVEKATFFGVMSEAHEIYRLPLVRPDPLLASMNELIASLEQDGVFDGEDLRSLAAQVRGLAKLPPDRQAEHLQEIKALLAQLKNWSRGADAERWKEIAGGALWGILSPGNDVADLYRSLAALAEHPPLPDHRETAYGRLRDQTETLIRKEEAEATHTRHWRAQLTDDPSEIEIAIQSGTTNEDTARFGPTLGTLVNDLYQYSMIPGDRRGERGDALLARLEALMREQRMPLPGGERDFMGEFRLPSIGPSPPPAAPLPLETRLTELWSQLDREMQTPGSGGFQAPKRFSGDPAKLPWRITANPGASTSAPEFTLKSRLQWLRETLAAIEGQRAALARDQEPVVMTRLPPSDHHEAGEAKDGEAETGSVETNHHPAPAEKTSHAAARLGGVVMFPSALRAARLAEVRQQLVEIQTSAEDLKQWWTASPAVTLELSLVGSFGFWVTVALLAAWSVTEPRKHGEGHG